MEPARVLALPRNASGCRRCGWLGDCVWDGGEERVLLKCDCVGKLRRARAARSDCVQEDCGVAGRGGADAAKSRLVREDCEKASAAKATMCEKAAKAKAAKSDRVQDCKRTKTVTRDRVWEACKGVREDTAERRKLPQAIMCEKPAKGKA